MNRPLFPFVAAALALVASACGGGAGHATPAAMPVAANGAAPAAAVARFSLTIPTRSALAGQRVPAYVSTSTLSASLQVNAGTVTGVDLGVASPNCTTVSGGRACIISAPAAIGSNTFALILYDGPLSAGLPTGNALSAASNFVSSVTEGTSNVATPLVLGGVPASVDVSAPTLLAHTPATVSLFVTAYDADGNTIVGPSAFVDGSGNTAPLTVAVAISSAQVTLHDGAQSGATIAVAGPADVTTLQLSGAADIIGVPFSVTNAAATRLAAKTRQTVAISGTLQAATKVTIPQQPDYKFFAPMDTTLANNVVNGFALVFGYQSNGGILGYFDDSTETLYSCNVPGTQADAGVAPVDGGLAFSWAGNLYTDSYPWGLSYLTLAQIRAGGTCPSGGSANSYETDNVSPADSVARALVYDKTAHRLFEGADSAAGPGGNVNPSLRYYGFSTPTISGGTVVSGPYGTYPESLVTVNGFRFFEYHGSAILAETGVAAPYIGAVNGTANITALAIGYDRRAYALDNNNHYVYAWDGVTAPVRYNAGTFASAAFALPWQLAVGPDGSVLSGNSSNGAQQIQPGGASQSVTLPTTYTPAYVEALFDGHNGYIYAILSDGSNGNYYIDRISY